MSDLQLCTRLVALADPTAADYQKKVISDTGYEMLCIRMPVLRAFARELSREDLQLMLQTENWKYYEQPLLLGLAIAYRKCPLQEKLPLLRKLLPHLDSWAHTDSIVPTLRVRPAELEQARQFSMECLASDRQYTVRFGILLLLHYFLTPQDLAWTLCQLCGVKDERYYVRMAVAWCLAEAAVTDPAAVLQLLESGTLDRLTHNKTIQKMRESYRIDQTIKDSCALLRRKDKL